MGVNWDKIAKKARKAFKTDFPEEMTITITKTGAYDITTGAAVGSSTSSHKTNGVIKTFGVRELNIVAPDEVEILFHSGSPIDIIPDLTSEKNITITAYGTVYKVKNIRAVRPAGVTIMYKAIAVESQDE